MTTTSAPRFSDRAPWGERGLAAQRQLLASIPSAALLDEIERRRVATDAKLVGFRQGEVAIDRETHVEVRGAYHREIAGFQARNATTERIGGQLEEAIRDVRRQLKRTREAYNCWIGTSWSRDSNPWHDPKTRGE